MSTLLGMKVVVSSVPMTRPVIKLSDHVCVTDKFRREFDAWALDLFGEQHYAVIVQPDAVIMDSMMLAEIKRRVPVSMEMALRGAA